MEYFAKKMFLGLLTCGFFVYMILWIVGIVFILKDLIEKSYIEHPELILSYWWMIPGTLIIVYIIGDSVENS